MADGKVLYALQDDVYILKFKGDIRFTICTSVDEFIQAIFEKPRKYPVIVDLLETEAVDSTALGVLAQIAIKMRDHFQQKPTIIINNVDLLMILQSVCFDKVFNIVTQKGGHDISEKYEELEQIEPNEKEFAEHVLKAHQSLMMISPANEEKFKDVEIVIKQSGLIQ